MPFVPGIMFHIRQHSGTARQLQQALSMPAATPINMGGERLIVPAMLLSAPINEGPQNSGLSKGLWRIPYSSTPTRGSNTVIVGHRFTYTNPEGVFYNLDKVKLGDEIGIFWHGKRYLYTVRKTEVVSPNDIQVQDPTKAAQVTLYTCTPLWFPKDRLVVIATEVSP
jgi:sortase A